MSDKGETKITIWGRGKTEMGVKFQRGKTKRKVLHNDHLPNNKTNVASEPKTNSLDYGMVT